MKNSTEKIRNELDLLIKSMENMDMEDFLNFNILYHEFYTRSLAVIRNLLPDRLMEFERLFHTADRKEFTVTTYCIEDFLHGIVYKTGKDEESMMVAKIKILNQINILKSAASRLDDILANIQGTLQADLFDSEIDEARALKKNGHYRAAGAIVGVVLERHLAKICQNHEISIAQKNPVISDFNEILKKSEIFDIPTWRWIQRLADIRNLCSHSKNRDPTSEEVQELIDSVDKAIKTIA